VTLVPSEPVAGYCRDDGAEAEAIPPEEAWQQRLKDEAGLPGDFGGGFGETYDAAGISADADNWDAWAGDEWQRPRASASHARQEQRESEDDFAQRIWQEMERRKTRQQQSYFRFVYDSEIQRFVSSTCCPQGTRGMLADAALACTQRSGGGTQPCG